jgi:hypothetical protein
MKNVSLRLLRAMNSHSNKNEDAIKLLAYKNQKLFLRLRNHRIAARKKNAVPLDGEVQYRQNKCPIENMAFERSNLVE